VKQFHDATGIPPGGRTGIAATSADLLHTPAPGGTTIDAHIRHATPDDLDFLVWVMMEAATSHLERSVWETTLEGTGHAVSDVLASVATSAEPHWCHWRRFLVAETGGRPVAAASSYDPSSEGNDALVPSFLAALKERGVSDERLPAVIDRSSVADACTPKPYADSWGIENVAVLPSHRGTGLVDALLRQAIEDARDRRREHVQIMCLDGNVRARRAWERNGFERRASYRSARFSEVFGCAGLELLVCDA
jgi:ribosomal protein S18 acetylase RimI-like enzyme